MKILLQTDNPNLPTGQARVGREIALALSKKHEVSYIGWYKDIDNPREWPFKLYPTPNSTFGKDIFDNVVRTERPDVVLTIGDPWAYGYIADPKICKTRNLFQWIGYTAVDGEAHGGGLPVFWKKIIDNMDRVIAYTQYGKNALKKTFPERDIDIIYHGVDEKMFFPVKGEQRNELKKKYGIKDKFIFLIIARNQGRKNLPEIFKAWKHIKENNLCPNAMLWPHTYFYDSAGHNLDDLIDTFGLKDTGSIAFFEQIARGQSSVNMLPENGLNVLYNIADTLISMGGEGFGLPIIEAMAAKVPCIVLGDSASGELAGDNGERAVRVEPAYYLTGKYLTERPVPDYLELAKKMVDLYLDKNHREQLKQTAFKFALNNTWGKIGDQWLDYFDKFEHPTKYPLILKEVS